MRVVDVTQVLAGPTAARTLAEYGAEVVKINNPWEEGPGYRWSRHRYHTDVNRGKATVLVDLKTTDGLDLFWRLADGADVVLQNFRRGVAERLGLGSAEVKARNPRAVYASISFYGYDGPWERLPGYEPNAQSATGVSLRSGRDGQPGMSPYAICDYSTGLLGALAVSLALFQRERSGAGQAVHACLAAAGTYLQLPYLYAGERVGAAETPRTPLGWSTLQRLFQTADGWLFLGASAAQADELGRCLGVTEVSDTLLEAAFRAKPTADWVEALAGRGIAAQAVVSPVALMSDPWVVAHGLSLTRAHQGGDQITTVGPSARLSRTPVTPGRPVSLPGGDAAEVLERLGIADRLGDLVARRALVLE
jgi:crotonobetainyl-CoA:carnitine CoA-transferase CaiB-like acyl-CoA transferase